MSLLPACFRVLAYRPFLDPLPVWDYCYLLALPLTVGVAVVYKSIRCETMRRVPLEAAKATLYILVGMSVAAAVLLGVVGWLER